MVLQIGLLAGPSTLVFRGKHFGIMLGQGKGCVFREGLDMLIFAIHSSWVLKLIAWFGKFSKIRLCCRLRLEVYYCGLLAPVLQLQQLGPEGDVKTSSLSDVAVFAFLLSICLFFHFIRSHQRALWWQTVGIADVY